MDHRAQTPRHGWRGLLSAASTPMPLTGHLGNPDLLAAAPVPAVADGPDLHQVVLLERDQQLCGRVVRFQNVGLTLSVLPVQNLQKTANQVKWTRSFSEFQTRVRNSKDTLLQMPCTWDGKAQCRPVLESVVLRKRSAFLGKCF